MNPAGFTGASDMFNDIWIARKSALSLARSLMAVLSGEVGAFKIGLQRYTADGPALVRAGPRLRVLQVTRPGRRARRRGG